MPQLVEVRFKGNRKSYYEWHEPEPLRPDEAVIVEADRGVDLGRVSAVGKTAQLKCTRCVACARNPAAEREEDEPPSPSARPEPEPTRRVVRRASPQDRHTGEELRRTEDEIRRKVKERAAAHGLAMKVSDAEWQWDRGKLTVYFTAEKRVDFRALVRDLAALFRTRIELRQIGVRDEAARLSGIGRCGRELCSASWLPELRPISLQIAKDQRLSLNPAQISGPCGRLLCCLRYEHEFYVQGRRRFPKEGKLLATSRGAEKVIAIDIFRDRVTLRAEDGVQRVVALADLKAEVERALEAPPQPAAQPAADVGAEGDGPRPADPSGRGPRGGTEPAPGASPPATGGATTPPGEPTAAPSRRRGRRRRRRGP
jgi:cell fate regulator YaaT (PSP1 superfamily)